MPNRPRSITETNDNAVLLLNGQEWVNILRPRQNGRHFPDDIIKCILLNENELISIPLNFVFKGPTNNIPAFVQIMAWHQPLFQRTTVNLLTHICVTRSQLFYKSRPAHIICMSRYQIDPFHLTFNTVFSGNQWVFLDYFQTLPLGIYRDSYSSGAIRNLCGSLQLNNSAIAGQVETCDQEHRTLVAGKCLFTIPVDMYVYVQATNSQRADYEYIIRPSISLHYSAFIWAYGFRTSQLPATWVFVQQFVQI